MKLSYVARQIISFFIIFYLLTTIGAYFFSDFHIFKQSKSYYLDNHHILKITTKDGIRLSAIYLLNPTAIYTVLVSHGNEEDLATSMWFLRLLHTQGLAVFSYDYQGYGTSLGRATEKNVYADINAAYDYLITQLHVPPNRIIAYGHSLGAAASIDLAARKPLAGLIVEGAFLSVYRTLTQLPLLPFDKFNNLKKIKNVRCPILMIHGTDDLIVPFWQGKKLYQEANSPKTFLAVPHAHHNNVVAVGREKYWEAIEIFLHTLNR